MPRVDIDLHLNWGLSAVSDNTTTHVREFVDNVYRSDSRQVLATLIRLLGDFDAAEEALHDAFAVAVERWSPLHNYRLSELNLETDPEHRY